MLIEKVSLTKAAEECGISRVTLYSWIKKGIVKVRKSPGGKVYMTREDVDSLKNLCERGVEE